MLSSIRTSTRGCIAVVVVIASPVIDAGSSRRAPSPPVAVSNPAIKTAPGLVVEDLTVGSGDTAEIDKTVSIHYTGWLKAAKFDTSLNRKPLQFRLGKGEVLRGWDLGIVGMKVGGKRKLTVPPELAYGHPGSLSGAIPPDSALVFEIELLTAKND